jgi:hypothetical protein
MATTLTSPSRTKPAGYLLFPWTLTSIVLILILNIFLKDWFGRNATWISLILVVPAAIIENIKLGYSSMKVMYLKIFYSLLSFLIVGLVFGLAIAGWYYERFQGITNIPRLDISWIVLLAIFVLMLLEMSHIFTLLKAVKREFVQYDTEG